MADSRYPWIPSKLKIGLEAFARAFGGKRVVIFHVCRVKEGWYEIAMYAKPNGRPAASAIDVRAVLGVFKNWEKRGKSSAVAQLGKVRGKNAILVPLYFIGQVFGMVVKLEIMPEYEKLYDAPLVFNVATETWTENEIEPIPGVHADEFARA